MKHIIILGGSYAGISTAHRILKYGAKDGQFKITLVAPNTHHYWMIASPRGIVPGQLTDEELFRPITAGFRQYNASQFEFVLATAENIDIEARKVDIRSSNDSQTMEYDFLILATGSHTTADMPFKMLGSTEATKDALHDLQERTKKAKSIVIAGAGVTGAEIAGELGFEYGHQKKITLISSGQTIVEEAPKSVSSLAMKELQKLNVEIKLHTRVLRSAETSDGHHVLTFADGSQLEAELYIPTFGLVPNSSYIPKRFLRPDGFVLVDQYLRVKGTENVWAIGDVAAIEAPQYITTDKQSAHLSKNICSIMMNKPPVPYKVAASRFVGFSIGRRTGSGFFGGIRLPSFIVAYARKTLFLERMGPMIEGTLF